MTDQSAPVAPPTFNTPPDIPSNEVPINPNPPSSPTPVGSQAPDKPPPSRREAIQAAFERANKPRGEKPTDLTPRKAPANQSPPAAEAKKGHNQPPEPTETERLDLKRRPGDQPRGERGQFAPRAQTPPETAPGEQTQTAKDNIGTPEKSSKVILPENAPFREPPPRMADHAKAEWATAPESVRGEVHRMHQEFSNAYNQLKPIADAFQPIARFHAMAQQHGTTLEKALTNYVSMEQKLRADPIGGLDVIVQNLGLTDPQTGQRLGLRDISYHVLSQSPEQLRQVQMGNQQSAAGQQIGALHAKINTLENALQQMHTAQQFTYTRAQVDQFAASHPRFDEIGAQIKQELDLGFDLETAYRRAELLSPATQAAQTRETTPSAQTRPADRSISGSPGGAAASSLAAAASRRSEKPVGRREAITNAIRRVNGGL
jgi:hypothetical protein